MTPSFEDLHQICHTIYKCYAHPFAFEEALNGTYQDPNSRVEIGDVWISPVKESSSLHNTAEESKPKGRKKRRDPKSATKEEEFNGDQVLAQTCRLMFDAMISREMVYATSDGDIG